MVEPKGPGSSEGSEHVSAVGDCEPEAPAAASLSVCGIGSQQRQRQGVQGRGESPYVRTPFGTGDQQVTLAESDIMGEPGRSTETPVPDIDSASNWLPSFTLSELSEMQAKDPVIQKVRTWLDSESQCPGRDVLSGECEEVRELCLQWPALVVRDGVVYRKASGKHALGAQYQLVAPNELRKVWDPGDGPRPSEPDFTGE